MKRVGTLAAGILSALLLSSATTRAGYITDYQVDMAISDPITNVLAFDEGAGGFSRVTPVSNIVGPGLVTIVNPNESTVPVDDYFLLGLNDFEGALHVTMSMTQQGVTATEGKLFFDDFDPFHESAIRQAILDVSTLPSSDPTYISSLGTLNSFASMFHDDLYASTGTGANLIRFSFPINVAVPVPSAVWGGLALLPLVAWFSRRKFARA